MKRYIIAPITLVALAACSDTTAAPEDRGFQTTMTVRAVDPTTHSLIRASVAPPTTLQPILVALNAPTVGANYASGSYDFVDSQGHANHLKSYWPIASSPATARYHIVDGKLLSTTVFTWVRTSTRYYAAKSVTTVYKNNVALGSSSVVGEIDIVSVPCPKGQVCKPATMAMRERFGRAVYALALATSSPALAQFGMYFMDCPGEWIAYLSAAAGMQVAIATSGEGGWLGMAAAAGGMSATLWMLEVCMQRGDTGPSPLFPHGSKANGSNSSLATCSLGAQTCMTMFTK